MKKLLVVLFVSILLTVTVRATSTTMTVDIPAQNVLVGNQYYVTVSLEGNPGFASVQMELFYDADVVQCVKVIPGDVVKGMLSDTNPYASGEQASAILSAAGFSNTSKDGTLVTFVFEKPKSGDPNFSFSLTELRNGTGSSVNCDVITIDKYVDAGVQDPPADGGTPTPPPTTDNPSGSGSAPGNPQGGTSVVPPTSDTIVPAWWLLLNQYISSAPKEDTDKKTESVPSAFRDELMQKDVEFTDVGESHWAKLYIEEAAARGVINGYPEGTFQPNSDMTRAEIATLLWNLSDRPMTSTKSVFEDVCYEDWYYQPVIWGYENGYLTSESLSHFKPNDIINREQVVAILYRYAGNPPAENGIAQYEDANTVSDFARPAMNWAVSAGIITGVDSTHLDPQGSITRAQISAIIVRYIHYIKAQTP